VKTGLKRKLIWSILAAAIVMIPFMAGQLRTRGHVFYRCFWRPGCGHGLLLEQAGLFSLAHPTFFWARRLCVRNTGGAGYRFSVAREYHRRCLCGGRLFYHRCASLRLRDYYLACATFALLLIVEISLAQLGPLTGGHEGLMGIPPLSIAGFVFETDRHYYYLAWALCLGSLWFLYNLMGSRVGRAVRVLQRQ